MRIVGAKGKSTSLHGRKRKHCCSSDVSWRRFSFPCQNHRWPAFDHETQGSGSGHAWTAYRIHWTAFGKCTWAQSSVRRSDHAEHTLPWEVGTDEFYDALQRSSGWNLGVEFIETTRDLMADDLEDIPAAFLDRLAAVDALLQNVDRTAQNPNLLRDATGDYWAIDFGACLFLDRFARYRQLITFQLPSNHFLAGRRLQLLQIEDANVPLQAIVSDMPDAWLGTGGRKALLDALSNILELYVQRAAHGRGG